MNFSRIKETCLYIEDLEQAKAFYKDMLGLEIISHLEGKHIFFRAGDSVLLCFNPKDSKTKDSPPPHFAQGPIHFAFEVAQQDYEATKKQIKLKGIEVIDEVNWKSGLESFYFKDTAGNVLEVVPEGIWD